MSNTESNQPAAGDVALHLTGDEAAHLKQQLGDAAPIPATPLPPGVRQATISFPWGGKLSVPVTDATGYFPTSVSLSLTGDEAQVLAALAGHLHAAGQIVEPNGSKALAWILGQLKGQ